jgi:RHS repeat-associated protein
MNPCTANSCNKTGNNTGDELLCAVVITETMYYVHKDYLGSISAITDASGNLVESLSYDPWGRRRKATDWTDYNVTSTMFDRGFTGHEHLPHFGLINMNGRVYDPFLARFLSPDPFIQAPGYTQNYNRYSYAWNNPLKYTDPDGEFIQFIIGGIIGGVSGYKMADNLGYKGWDKFWYTLGGAAIGTATAGIGTAVASSAGIVAGGIVGGAAGGTGFGTLGGYAAGLRGADLIGAGFDGMWKGAVTGLAGSVVGGAIGGGWGALSGGATSGAIGTWLNGGSGDDILKGAAFGAFVGLGVYHVSLAYSYHASGIKSTGLYYNQYAKMMATTQRSMFWNREGKFIPNSKGGINVNKLGGVNDVGAMGTDYNDALFDYHTHQDWGSTLADGEGFSTYASGGVASDEYARQLLNSLVKFKGPMYLGTREGNIWYMNSDFSRGMLPYNFSPIFTPFNITWSLIFNPIK